MITQKGSVLRFRSKRYMKERLAFIKLHVKRLKENPDAVLRQQVKFVNSFLASTKDFPLTREEYLKMKGELREGN